MIQITQIKLKAGTGRDEILKAAAKKLGIPSGKIGSVKILRHSVDARKKPLLYDIYTAGITLSSPGEERALVRRRKDPNISIREEIRYRFPENLICPKERSKDALRPVIAGAGPAGLFCALILAENGWRPVVVERGREVDKRTRDVETFWETGKLDPESNVQFGEGGAGTFSDGKLNTNATDRAGRTGKVLETFVQAGAPEDILYEFHPHIGTDRLRQVVRSMRERILSLGGEFLFETRLCGILQKDGTLTGILAEKQTPDGKEKITIPADALVLAVGHSARDTFRMLLEEGIFMEAKDFAVGLRAIHPQSLIDQAQYGISDPEELEKLGLTASSYRLAAKAKDGRGVYSFCMCPGGFVVNASSEEGGLAVNGMSDYRRDSGSANSAIVVSVGKDDFKGQDPLSGMRFQEELEKKAWRLAGGALPVQSYPEYKKCFEDPASQSTIAEQDAARDVEEKLGTESFQVRGMWKSAPLHTLLPEALSEAFIEGMEAFGKKIPGFSGEECLLLGPESRTSSPVRIPRDQNMMSSLKGLIPCGEGAGYAGGITSAAIDGIKAAEACAAWLSGKI